MGAHTAKFEQNDFKMQLRMVQPATIPGSSTVAISGEGTGTAAGATTSEPSQPSVPEPADESSNLIIGYYDLESEVHSPAEGEGKIVQVLFRYKRTVRHLRIREENKMLNTADKDLKDLQKEILEDD